MLHVRACFKTYKNSLTFIMSRKQIFLFMFTNELSLIYIFKIIACSQCEKVSYQFFINFVVSVYILLFFEAGTYCIQHVNYSLSFLNVNTSLV